MRNLLGGSPLVQQTEICLPSNRNNAPKNTPILKGDICKTKRRDRRPKLTRINPAGWDSVLDALENLARRGAAEKGLHAEEVGVEDGCEHELVHCDLEITRKHERGSKG